MAKFDVVYIGTILHYDSVLNRTLANKMWRSAKFKALLKWPDNMALWERWEELLGVLKMPSPPLPATLLDLAMAEVLSHVQPDMRESRRILQGTVINAAQAGDGALLVFCGVGHGVFRSGASQSWIKRCTGWQYKLPAL